MTRLQRLSLAAALMWLSACARQPGRVQPSFSDLLSSSEIERPRWNRQGDLAYISNESGALRAHWQDAQGHGGSSPHAGVTLASWQPRQRLLALQYDPDGSENTQLAEWDPQANTTRPLVVEPGRIQHFGTFSKNGRLAYSSNSRQPADFDLYLLDLASGQPRRLLSGAGLNVPLRFSPHGERLLFYHEQGTLDQQLGEVELTSGHTRRLTPPGPPSLYLSPRYHGSGQLWTLSNLGGDYLGLISMELNSGRYRRLWQGAADIEDWDQDRQRRRLAFCLNQHGYSHLQIQPQEGGPALACGPLPAGVYSQLAFRPDGSLTLLVNGPHQPSSLWQVWPGTSQTRLLLGQHLALDDWPVPVPVRFASADGTMLGGLLSGPPGARAGVVVLHGGPASQSRPTFSPLLLWLSRHGMAVLQLDVRGSTGYGRAFAQLDDGPGRLGAVEDVQAAATYLRGRGVQRLALMGHSYGGYLAWLSAVRQPGVWSAVVVGAGISDLPAFLQTTAAWRVPNRLAEYGQASADSALSPLRQVSRIKVPVLIYHGLNDTRVPFQQGERMAQALQRQGNRVMWMPLTGEGHRIELPSSRRQLAQAVAQFLESSLSQP